ncbi:acyl carrier protein [Radicibacter daui]|uniref:acyl carrier protein n=1 Tax=Radicibacter daui TaxID=3064829 RepID=UPI004046D4A3
MRSREDVYQKLQELLVELFDVPAERVKPDALLFEDLELDSIDAVDLMVRFQELTGKKISPAEFKSVRTVDDVVGKIHALLGS